MRLYGHIFCVVPSHLHAVGDNFRALSERESIDGKSD
jgi:hypothetical protein